MHTYLWCEAEIDEWLNKNLKNDAGVHNGKSHPAAGGHWVSDMVTLLELQC